MTIRSLACVVAVERFAHHCLGLGLGLLDVNYLVKRYAKRMIVGRVVDSAGEGCAR